MADIKENIYEEEITDSVEETNPLTDNSEVDIKELRNPAEIKKDNNVHLDTKQSDKATTSNSDAKINAKQNNELKNIDSAGKLIGGRGGSKPWIYINDFPITDYMIDELEIRMTGFYPTVFLQFSLKSGVFTTKNLPKDGDVISIFIRSHTDILIPVEVHFLITKVETSRSKDAEGSELTYFIDGILNVPYLYAEDCYVVPDASSIRALAAISSKLKLGFATNQKKTEDKQNWICAWQTNKDFIKSITEHAWVDDNSFFDCWIDWYYKLNFSNMNKQMSAPDNTETKIGLAHYVDDNMDHKKTASLVERDIKHVLTNQKSARSSNYFFDSIEFMGNGGEINITNGYKRYVHFYEYSFRKAYQDSKDPINDKIEDKVQDLHSIIWVDPVTTEGAEKSKRLQKGRAGENFYEKTVKRKWQGIQYFDSDDKYKNVHPYYRFAEFQNFQNNSDIKKLMLVTHLPKCNFNFYRGQVIKVFYAINEDNERGKSAGNTEDNQEKTGAGIDRALSGTYTIYGINIIYKNQKKNRQTDTVGTGTFSQQLILGRREWPVPTSPTNKEIALNSSDQLYEK